MKANAPDKLYIALNELTEDGRTFVLDHRVDYPICTEYTCTDAFIEKACDWLENNLQGIVGGSIYIEDFEEYMKGE